MLATVQSALFTVDGKWDEYRGLHSVAVQRCDGMEMLLCPLCSRLVDHSFLVDSVRGSLHQE